MKSSEPASFEDIFHRKLLRRNDEKSKESIQRAVSKSTLIFDVRPLDVREMKAEEFKKSYFKSKQFNKYKKYVQTEEMRRLFKELL